ncbi:MAG: hypothetical protein AAGN46_13475 [Acidobacteriota bacterium]
MANGFSQVPDSLKFTVPAAVIDGEPGAVAEIYVADSAGLGVALATGGDLSNATDAKLRVGAGTGEQALVFSDGLARLRFFGSAENRLRVLDSPAELAEERELLPDAVASALELPSLGEGRRYLMMRWDYDLAGLVEAPIALANGVTGGFAVDGVGDARFVIVREIDEEVGAKEAIERLLEAWRSPRQLAAIDGEGPTARAAMTEPTWIVTELFGRISSTLEIGYGYDFSWIRSLRLGELSGDLALKVQAGLKAAIGGSLAGRFALVMAFETPQRVRVRLLKSKAKGWNFALDVGLQLDGLESALPEGGLDDLVKAILGIHDHQLLADLEKWLDPNKTLAEIAGDEGEKYLGSLAKKVFGAKGNLAKAKVAELQGELKRLLEFWSSVDARLASALWNELGTTESVEAIRSLAQDIVEADDVPGLVRSQLETTGFFSTPDGDWLRQAAEVAAGGLATVLASDEAVGSLQSLAGKTLALLSEDGALAASTKLKQALDERFGLKAIAEKLAAAERTISSATLADLDPWVAERLRRFLGADELSFEGLESLRSVLGTFLNGAAAQSIYAAGRQALEAGVRADLGFSYARLKENGALVDATFDLGADPEVARLLERLVDGDVDLSALDQSEGVTLHEGFLTHRMARERRVGLSLPLFQSEVVATTAAWSEVEAAADGSGVLLYRGGATNEAARRRAQVLKASRLSLAISLPSALREGLHDWRSRELDSPAGNVDWTYTLDRFLPAATPDDLVETVQFLRRVEGETLGADPAAARTVAWAGDVDRATDNVAGYGSGTVGNTRLVYNVVFPEGIGSVWREAPLRPDIRFDRRLSIQMQRELRESVPRIYFGDPDLYRDERSYPLLLWSAFPLRTQVFETRKGIWQLVDDGKALITPWDKNDNWLRIANSDDFLDRLDRRLEAIEQRLVGRGKERLRSARQIKDAVLGNPNLKNQVLEVFAFERQLIGRTVRAVHLFGSLRSGARPQADVLDDLAEFSTALSKTFNEKFSVGGLTDRGELRAGGSWVFFRVAQAFAAALGQTVPEPTSLLEVTVVAPSIDAERIASGPPLERDEVVLRQMIENLVV